MEPNNVENSLDLFFLQYTLAYQNAAIHFSTIVEGTRYRFLFEYNGTHYQNIKNAMNKRRQSSNFTGL